MTSSFDPSSLAPTIAGSTTAPYRFSIDGFDADHFSVHAFTGREALSEHYAFDVVVTAETATDEEVEGLALGRRAVFTWGVGKAPRAFYGVVAAVRLEDVHQTHGSVQYHVRFVPRLWMLRRKKRTRIFQNLRVPEIVNAVLREAGIPTRWLLLRDYPVREYATQYEDTNDREPEDSAWRAFPQGSRSSGLSATALYGTRKPSKTLRAGNRVESAAPGMPREKAACARRRVGQIWRHDGRAGCGAGASRGSRRGRSSEG